MTPQLLVSVRSAAEAEEALAGGADLIDVKEPDAGSLGRASAATIAAVVEVVKGRVPTSAALGELRDWDGTMPGGVDYVKAGLAGLGESDWRSLLDAFRGAACGRAVIVGYADWDIAAAPRLEDVVAYAERIREPILLIDTHRKNGSTLFDDVGEADLAKFTARIRQAEGRIALAGSLHRTMASRLTSLKADLIAVRRAVCDGGRAGSVQRRHVRELKRRIAGIG